MHATTHNLSYNILEKNQFYVILSKPLCFNPSGGLVVICTLSATLGHEGVQRVVQSGRQALQTGPAQYCEEMEFAVQATSHGPRHQQVATVLVCVSSCTA